MLRRNQGLPVSVIPTLRKRKPKTKTFDTDSPKSPLEESPLKSFAGWVIQAPCEGQLKSQLRLSEVTSVPPDSATTFPASLRFPPRRKAGKKKKVCRADQSPSAAVNRGRLVARSRRVADELLRQGYPRLGKPASYYKRPSKRQLNGLFFVFNKGYRVFCHPRIDRGSVKCPPETDAPGAQNNIVIPPQCRGIH